MKGFPGKNRPFDYSVSNSHGGGGLHDTCVKDEAFIMMNFLSLGKRNPDRSKVDVLDLQRELEQAPANREWRNNLMSSLTTTGGIEQRSLEQSKKPEVSVDRRSTCDDEDDTFNVFYVASRPSFISLYASGCLSNNLKSDLNLQKAYSILSLILFHVPSCVLAIRSVVVHSENRASPFYPSSIANLASVLTGLSCVLSLLLHTSNLQNVLQIYEKILQRTSHSFLKGFTRRIKLVSWTISILALIFLIAGLSIYQTYSYSDHGVIKDFPGIAKDSSVEVKLVVLISTSIAGFFPLYAQLSVMATFLTLCAGLGLILEYSQNIINSSSGKSSAQQSLDKVLEFRQFNRLIHEAITEIQRCFGPGLFSVLVGCTLANVFLVDILVFWDDSKNGERDIIYGCVMAWVIHSFLMIAFLSVATSHIQQRVHEPLYALVQHMPMETVTENYQYKKMVTIFYTVNT